MQDNRKTTLEQLKEQEYRHVICYPTCKEEEFKDRLKELKKLSIEAIEFTGQKSINNTPVLGKGCVGIVVKAYRKAEKVAIKIRRTDANRLTMQHEAEMLKKANEMNVGPCLLGITKNFLVMEYVEGALLPEWVKALRRTNSKERLCRVLQLLLEQAWRLDKAGLDHGELSHAPKHIIVKPDGTPCLIDFETASISRRASNVTSLCQYLIIGSPVAKVIKRKLIGINENKLVETLRTYKQKKNKKNFEEILKKCKILKDVHHRTYNKR